MTTSAPSVVAFGDIQQVTMVAHAGGIVSVCLRSGGLVSLHVDGDAPEALVDLPFAGSKDKLAAAVVGDILNMAWGSGGEINFARWNLTSETVDMSPSGVFGGSRPTLQSFHATRLLLSYVSPGSKHERRTSLDMGDNWTAATQIHAVNVTDVDVHVSPVDENNAVWVETDV